MNKKRHLLLVVLVIALLVIPTMVVFAKELGSLTITGPGIKGELSLNDPKFMMKLEQSGFFDQAVLSNTPKNLNLDAGYKITAVLNLDGKMTPYLEAVYYPTEKGQAGYVHYTSRLKGDSMQAVDEWNIVNRGADDAFRTMLTANNVTVQSALVAASVKAEAPAAAPAASAAEPVTVPVTSSASIPASYIILAIGAMVVLLLGAGLAIRRRTMSAAS